MVCVPPESHLLFLWIKISIICTTNSSCLLINVTTHPTHLFTLYTSHSISTRERNDFSRFPQCMVPTMLDFCCTWSNFCWLNCGVLIWLSGCCSRSRTRARDNSLAFLMINQIRNPDDSESIPSSVGRQFLPLKFNPLSVPISLWNDLDLQLD